MYGFFPRKESVYLGEHWAKGIPVEVLPIAYVPVKQKLEQKIGGKANLRMAKHKAVSFLIIFFVDNVVVAVFVVVVVIVVEVCVMVIIISHIVALVIVVDI